MFSRNMLLGHNQSFATYNVFTTKNNLSFNPVASPVSNSGFTNVMGTLSF